MIDGQLLSSFEHLAPGFVRNLFENLLAVGKIFLLLPASTVAPHARAAHRTPHSGNSPAIASVSRLLPIGILALAFHKNRIHGGDRALGCFDRGCQRLLATAIEAGSRPAAARLKIVTCDTERSFASSFVRQYSADLLDLVRK